MLELESDNILTVEEEEILLESYKRMEEEAKKGKFVYTFDQEWLM
jgi:hypothetical protein